MRWTCPLVLGLLCLTLCLPGCGKKGPPVPLDAPTDHDEKPQGKPGKVQIVDDTGKRLFDLYGKGENAQAQPPEEAVESSQPLDAQAPDDTAAGSDEPDEQQPDAEADQ